MKHQENKKVANYVRVVPSENHHEFRSKDYEHLILTQEQKELFDSCKPIEAVSVPAKANRIPLMSRESDHVSRIKEILNQHNLSEDTLYEIFSELAKYESETKSRSMIDSFDMKGVITM